MFKSLSLQYLFSRFFFLHLSRYLSIQNLKFSNLTDHFVPKWSANFKGDDCNLHLKSFLRRICSIRMVFKPRWYIWCESWQSLDWFDRQPLILGHVLHSALPKIASNSVWFVPQCFWPLIYKVFYFFHRYSLWYLFQWQMNLVIVWRNRDKLNKKIKYVVKKFTRTFHLEGDIIAKKFNQFFQSDRISWFKLNGHWNIWAV